MADLSNLIISVFLDRQVLVFKDFEILRELAARRIPCDSNAVRRNVERLSPALFKYSYDNENNMNIAIEPQVINIY